MDSLIRAFKRKFGMDDKMDSSDAQIAICMEQIKNDLIQKSENEMDAMDLLVRTQPNSTSPILNTLNDDCLREICKYLEFSDLLSCADVCIRFNHIAKGIFSTKYKALVIGSDSVLFDQPKDVEALQRNFGELIYSLSVEADVQSLDLITLVGFNGKLKSLCPLFRKIKKLKLKGCGMEDDLSKVLSVCDELNTLHLDYCDLSNGKCIKRKFAKLEEAHFVSILGIDEAELSSFFTLNPKLKRLSILRNSDINPSKTLLSISKNLRNLVELDFQEVTHALHEFEKSVAHLDRLKWLKVLKLDFRSLPVSPLMKGLVAIQAPIEHLKIKRGEMDIDAIMAISQMKHMQFLELSEVDALTDEYLIKLAEELHRLKEIHLEDLSYAPTTIGVLEVLSYAKRVSVLSLKSVENFTIDVDDFETILSIVKSRPEKFKLFIQIMHNGEKGKKVDVPEAILLKNNNYLHIDEQIEVTFKRC